MERPQTIDVLKKNVPRHSHTIRDPFVGQQEGALRCDGSSLIVRSLEPQVVILEHEHHIEEGIKSHWLTLDTTERRIIHTTFQGPSVTSPDTYGLLLDGGVSGELINLVCGARSLEGLKLQRETTHYLGAPMIVKISCINPFDLLDEISPGNTFTNLRDFTLNVYDEAIETVEQVGGQRV